ncbi:2-succinyl-5-enolpyruvyl-6-hydroxy-3-cyclohexene- 1-carboxylate synthase [Patiriisocius marinus]|uniref:2-succinyl-5-enolpyruvyl-6-hydroxy-3-cyclohexene-1-carboxylate synthase n=1 Tax=Patiriisocius marinus TaxID=1397112 RepID=A0A5J4J4C9_9FLAO|nr:2-succinyl-5-enolpyruvyl-6-hydroxy-3-cyclohexene-1-carboxylic-acid synthase [Patiriisocius marinus]GER59327.1 2-succinyl-5-enolpyruvyl-6-hydroxy-3-cyclohexene- 1-carboxylate synthase [Patiriisocius marinus]
MKFSEKNLSQTVVQLCLAKDIEHIVLSPGSRNAPLTIGFTSHPGFTNYSVVDERCAAFFALGMAQQLGKPVAVVCTSGSALLNYYPAIAEAFYSDIPLIILSADRPEHLLEIGDGQTVIQENVYRNHILYNGNCKEGEEFQIHNETVINTALNSAIELSGPVHINIPFNEPLYNLVDIPTVRPQDVPARAINISAFNQTEMLQEFSSLWNTSTKKMILVGVLKPNSIEQKFIDFIANDESVLVLTETTSNLHNDQFITAIDQLIEPLNNKQQVTLEPEVLLTFGGMIISKKIKVFLRNCKNMKHYHVDTKKAYDTFFKLEGHFKCTINTFFKQLVENSKPINSNYQSHWLSVKENRLLRHESFVENIKYSDFSVYQYIFKYLNNECSVHISNSAAIRYAQLFDNKQLQTFCNRGTSGIDGSLSTAIGAAVHSTLPIIHITGDLSFLYDSNGLWNNNIPSNFKIIVINNSGGGIFRILPKAKKMDHFETFFETRHHLNASHLCAMYGLEYFKAQSMSEVESLFSKFLEHSTKPALIEIFTPPEINDTVLMKYFKFIGE